MAELTMALMAGPVVAQDSFEDEFREWAADGYGSAALFVIVMLLVIVVILRGTRTKY